jgi:two-component system, sensor histidine kinase RegB
MWLAGTVAAELVAYFVGRASIALQRREEALEQMRRRAARSERLVSLTTLAAGTAHELSTPLATIALTARELQRALERRNAGRELTEDARLIRSEVDRCQAILDQMSGRAGGSTADQPEVVPLAEFAERPALGPGRESRWPAGRACGPRLVARARAACRTAVDAPLRTSLAFLENL